MFRNVWHGGQRYIQGALIDRARFVDQAVASAYRASSLAAMSDVAVDVSRPSARDAACVDRRCVVRVVSRHGSRGNAAAPRAAVAAVRRSRARVQRESVAERARRIAAALDLADARGRALRRFLFHVSLRRRAAAARAAAAGLRLGRESRAQDSAHFDPHVRRDVEGRLGRRREEADLLRLHPQRERAALAAHRERAAARAAHSQQPTARREARRERGAARHGALEVCDAGRARGLQAHGPRRRARRHGARARRRRVRANPHQPRRQRAEVLRGRRSARRSRSRAGSRRTAGYCSRSATSAPAFRRGSSRRSSSCSTGPPDEITRATAGTGIGLALVLQLTAALGGRVEVRNCEPGAEFRVSFPAAGPTS